MSHLFNRMAERAQMGNPAGMRASDRDAVGGQERPAPHRAPHRRTPAVGGGCTVGGGCAFRGAGMCGGSGEGRRESCVAGEGGAVVT